MVGRGCQTSPAADPVGVQLIATSFGISLIHTPGCASGCWYRATLQLVI